MKKWLCITLLMVILSGHNTLFADTFFENDKMPAFEYIGKEQGVQDPSVSNIVQDKNGFIWFGTQGGLFRFDGRESVSYRNDPFDTKGLIHNLIQTIYYDLDQHSLWLGTYQGISKLDITQNRFTNYTVDDNHLSNNVVIDIAKDRNDDLWFGTMDGLNKLNQETGMFVNYPVEGKVVRSLLLDSSGRMLVGTYEGLFYLDEEKEALVKVEMDYPSTYVMVIKEFEKGILTFGLWDGGVLQTDLNFNPVQHYTYEDNRIYCLTQTRDHVLWTGTWGGGLFAQKGDEVYHFGGSGRRGDIGHDVLYSFLEDRTGILWIGTNGGGIYKTNPRKGNYLLYANDPEVSESLDAGKINNIYRDAQNRLWVAVYNKGLNRFDIGKEKPIKYSVDNSDGRTIENDQVMDFLEFEDELYIATGSGVSRYDPLTDRFERLGILPEDTITYALEMDQEGHIWVGSYLDGVYEFDRDFKQLNHLNIDNIDMTLTDNLVYDIVVDSQNRVWIGTNNGLNMYDQNQNAFRTFFKEEGNRQGLASNIIRALYKDDNGSIWVGMSGGGVARYIDATDSFISYTETEGLVDNTVVDIKESSNGLMWIATHGGISIIDSKTETISNLAIDETTERYTFTGEGFKDQDGSIYYGGTQGVMRFPADSEWLTDQLPPVYITNMLLYNTPIDEHVEVFNDLEYQLTSDENYISFEFSAIDYETVSQLQYYYKLSTVDNEWVKGGNRHFASYSNLAPGYYTFSVRVKTFQGKYTDPVSVSMVIQRPWYNSFWAYVVYAFALLFILYSILKIRENQMVTRRNSELAKLNQQLEEAVNELEKVSIKDPLTDIYNRRYFDTVMKDHLELAKRGYNHLSLLMIDIDDFKEINDEYGHVFGDHFLIAFADNMARLLTRSTDFVARYGGDEFVVVLYDTDEEGTRLMVDRIYKRVKKLEVLNENQMITFETSISIGVCSMVPSPDVAMETFISKADDALYDAKETGKNKAVFSE